MHLRKPSPTSMVAVLALFFALAGTAIATNHYLITTTSQIKPSVLKKLKGYAGQSGAVGPQGAQGKEGLQGKEGPQGKEGLQGNEGPKGQTGSEGPAGVGLAALFGDGSDGDVTISTNDEKLTRDMYYHDLTVANDITLNPNGWRIFVSGTLTLEEGAQIARDGEPGELAHGGAELAAGSLGGAAGGGGGLGGGKDGGATIDSLGGAGGAGSAGGGSGGDAAAPSADAGGPNVFRSAVAATSGHDLTGVQIEGGGGGGGGGGGEGEGGGAGGGVVVVAAQTVVLDGSSASIHAAGGEGEHGGGVGGGGGGGVVVVVSTEAQPAGLILSAKGGAGHTAGSEGFTDWLG